MKRQSKNLSFSMERRLSGYALGAGLLTLAQPAEARIVYIKAHSVIGPNGDLWFNMVNGQTDLIFVADWSSTSGVSGGDLWVNPRSGNFLGHYGDGDWNAAALPAGYSVSRHDKSNSFNQNNYRGMMAGFLCSDGRKCSFIGDWLNVKNRYLGVEFRFKGKVHFGWARLNASCIKHFGCTALLTGFAYETIPNKPIITGKTKEPDVITVEPGSLGTLAAGHRGGSR